jgi:hypothetical protein
VILDYLRERKLVCPGCGLPRDETMDPEAEGHFISRFVICHACAARDRKQKQITSAGPYSEAGAYFSVERRLIG